MTNRDRGRIQRVSRRFRLLFTALLIALPVLTVAYWAFFNLLSAGFHAGLPVPPQGPLSTGQLVLACLANFIPLSVLLYGMRQLVQLFGWYEQGRVFTAETVQCFRRLGFVLIFFIFARILSATLIGLIISFTNPAGQRVLGIGFSSNDLFVILIGAIVILVSWVMDEGRKLEDDVSFTV